MLASLLICSVAVVLGQQRAGVPAGQKTQKPVQASPTTPPIQHLGNGVFRMGTVTIDTKAKEVSVPGTINDVVTLEFLVNAQKGAKGYESAIEADVGALPYNVALLLIGVDAANATIPQRDREPAPPQGDPVEVLVKWQEGGTERTIRGEELVVRGKANDPLPRAPWVYTGSVTEPQRKLMLAVLDGVLIGFMHTRSSLIDYGGQLEGKYGEYYLNKSLVKPGTRVTVVVRALPRGK
jgi:hypothetical protein